MSRRGLRMIGAVLALALIGCTTPSIPPTTTATRTPTANIRLTLTAGAKTRVAATATAKAEVAATATAPAVATIIAAAAPKVTARVATATARAALVNSTGTARAVSAEATATSAGLLISAPKEVKWHWDGEKHKWMWNIEFKEVAGRTITITTRNTDLYHVDGAHYVDSGSHTVNIAVAAYGGWVDDYWIRSDVGGLAHDGTCVLTYKVVDERGSEFSVQAVTRLKDEEE